jgi:hypothetical protein
MSQQAINLVLAGMTKSQILSVTGLSGEAFDALLADPAFVEQVRSLKSAKLEEDIEAKYGKLEDAALKQVHEQVSSGYYDASSLCKVLETVSRARSLRRQTHTLPNNGHYTNPTLGVSVTVPIFLNSQVTLDSNRQVVAVDGRNMAPLPSEQVHTLFARLESQKENQNGTESEVDPILADLEEEAAKRAAREAINRAASQTTA